MKKKIVIVVIILCSLLVLAVVKDLVIKSVVTVVATQVAGAPVHMDGFSLGVINQVVKITGFKMYNPKGFPKGVLADLPLIKVSYNLVALLEGKIHIKNAEINLNEIGLVKDKEGKLNVDELKVVKDSKDKPGDPVKQMSFLINVLKLKMNKVVIKDYSGKSEPVVTVYNINLDKTYKNISSVQELIALLISEPMKAAGIKGAAIYGIAAISGVAILPVAVTAMIIGRDSATEEYPYSIDKTYDLSLAVLRKKGRVTKEDKAAGVISGVVNSAQIYIKVRKNAANKTEITVSARKYFLPKPEIAAGIIHEISGTIK